MAEIGLGGDRQIRRVQVGRPNQRHAAPAQRPGEGQFGQPLRQRHDGGERHGRRPADEDIDPKRLPRSNAAA